MIGEERAQLHKYLLLLRKWNAVHRLVGSAESEWIVIHVILDSLLFLRVLPPDAQAVLDLGAGAGIPGVPLKIVRPELDVVLIEGRSRRASFLAEVTRHLGLERCTVVAARAEAVTARYGGAFDAVVMRCAGTFGVVVPLAQQFLRPGGLVVVTGPPKPTKGRPGTWIEVPGARPGDLRHFLVVSKEQTL